MTSAEVVLNKSVSAHCEMLLLGPVIKFHAAITIQRWANCRKSVWQLTPLPLAFCDHISFSGVNWRIRYSLFVIG